MEGLPTEIMTKVLDYLVIPARIKLARCSRALQKRVYRDCSQAWKRMDFFEYMDESFRERLTDAALSNLLIRVNAIETTQILILADFTRIRGQGLLPLLGSRALEILNLEGTSVEENEAQVLWTIGSMLPYKLHSLIVSENANERFVELKRNLRFIGHEKAKTEGIQCSCCHEPAVEKHAQTVATKHGYPAIHCLECNRPWCRRGSCPGGMRECQECSETYCTNCNIAHQCYVCGHNYCGDCNDFYRCIECGKWGCEDCNGVDGCSNGSCTNNVCQDCGQCPELCSNGCLFCRRCQDDGACASCNEKFCFECVEGSSVCSVCLKTFCGKSSCDNETKKCEACSQVFCSDCQDLERCGRCDKDFCANHNRLVDCTSCEMRHCRTCKSGKHCVLCSASCYEACVCAPAKRRKLA